MKEKIKQAIALFGSPQHRRRAASEEQADESSQR